jgi:hypothetical protein
VTNRAATPLAFRCVAVSALSGTRIWATPPKNSNAATCALIHAPIRVSTNARQNTQPEKGNTPTNRYALTTSPATHGIHERDRVTGPVHEQRPPRLVLQRRDQIVANRILAGQVAVCAYPCLRNDEPRPTYARRSRRADGGFQAGLVAWRCAGSTWRALSISANA